MSHVCQQLEALIGRRVEFEDFTGKIYQGELHHGKEYHSGRYILRRPGNGDFIFYKSHIKLKTLKVIG